MEGYFKRGDFTGGLVHGIARAGALLAAHFPPILDGIIQTPSASD
jgi:uncharacterized membrane protein